MADKSLGDKKPQRNSKTFTGCFTCRSRKIRCDLHRPFCSNCKKSGLTCGGYDINLRWLKPLQYRYNNGSPIQVPVTFGQDVKSVEDDGGSSKFFKRRRVAFVVWDESTVKPYLFYEDMDDDINALKALNHNNETKMKGPFGVFALQPRLQVPNLDAIPTNELSSAENASRFQDIPYQGHDQLWLSNELREHALLTAAALNGDPQFLDFDMQSMGFQGYSDSLNDLLNLLFHRHPQNPIPSLHTHTPNNQSQISTPSASHKGPLMLDNKIAQDDILINPTNQHLFYSNFTNFYYNNPYQLNHTLDIQLHASAEVLKHDDESTDFVEGDVSQATQMPDSLMSITQSPLEPKIGFDVSLPKHGVTLPTSALQVQPLTRYLLNYYVTQVADLMTVIPLTENPWKTIYFPRALMAIGELAALGKTSIAKSALLNALLAVSAFNLQSKFTKNSQQMKYYLNLGIRLRNQASLFVKALLGSLGGSQCGVDRCISSEKYKDILCAIMSMISVDLVWGTMQDTNIYIKWCERIIYTKMTKKKKLSAKAKILHRIFLSLKLIQDSTCLNIADIKEDVEMNKKFGQEIRLKFDDGVYAKTFKAKKSKIDYIVDQSKLFSPMFVNKKLINTDKYDENFATDALYGLPNSLISAFSETVHLVRKKIYHQEASFNLPNQFEEQVAKLSEMLQNWKLDWKLYETEDNTKAFSSSMHEATFHHVMSFYNALCIYFHRLIEEIPPEKLQDKVETTLEHLNKIQRLIAEDKASMIPLFWQGFIAGCEATSLNLQMGFKKWCADIALYLGNYWGARQIMLEVWRRKKFKEARDDWPSVVLDWEMNLMLN